MSISERNSSVKRSVRAPASSENVLLVIVAFAVLALHILIGMYVYRVLPHEPTQELKQTAVVYGD